jgi:hypothetical protein
MILAKCVLLMAASLELNAENTPDVLAEYSQLFNSGLVTLTDYPSCTRQGAFAINCTSYRVCLAVKGRFLGAERTCPSQQNFNPVKKECSSSYVCQPSCTEPGFICPSSTSFTLCAAAGIPIAENYKCQTGYLCNQKCTFPCVDTIAKC